MGAPKNVLTSEFTSTSGKSDRGTSWKQGEAKKSSVESETNSTMQHSYSKPISKPAHGEA